MPKIEEDMPESVLTTLARACGFSVSYDRAPGADRWCLSAGHGEDFVEHVGTRRGVCAFLSGYVTMRANAMDVLQIVDDAHRRIVKDAKRAMNAYVRANAMDVLQIVDDAHRRIVKDDDAYEKVDVDEVRRG